VVVAVLSAGMEKLRPNEMNEINEMAGVKPVMTISDGRVVFEA
jgi:hypothetical protein